LIAFGTKQLRLSSAHSQNSYLRLARDIGAALRHFKSSFRGFGLAINCVSAYHAYRKQTEYVNAGDRKKLF